MCDCFVLSGPHAYSTKRLDVSQEYDTYESLSEHGEKLDHYGNRVNLLDLNSAFERHRSVMYRGIPGDSVGEILLVVEASRRREG